MRRRVLRALTRMNVGGPARQAATMMRELPLRGDECRLLIGRPDPHEGEVPVTGTVAVVPSLRRAIDPAADLRAFRAVDRLVGEFQPHVTHSHMAKAGAIVRMAARRNRVPAIVHTFHGHVLEGYFPKPIARTFLEAERRLARITDAIVAVAPQIRDELLRLGVGRPEQWRVVPVGVDLGPILAARQTRSEARTSLGWVDRPTIGIVGRLAPVKDVALFLQAADIVAQRLPDVRFVIAGDGELREELEWAGRRLGDRVLFTGWMFDLPTLYRALDVVVLTSKNEGTPFSLIEAGAARTPVVAANVGGVAEVVADGRTGSLVDTRDAWAFAAAIIEVLGDPERAQRFGDAAREHVNAGFSQGALVDRLSALYDELLAAKGILTL